MDLRSNYVTWLTGAPRRIGYDFGGGSFLLTDAVPAEPDTRHRVDDWLELLRPLGITDRFEPQLAVSEEERAQAREILAAHAIGAHETIVAVHGGASDPRRKWPEAKYESVAKTLVGRYGVKIVWFRSGRAARARAVLPQC